ncbi:RNA dependent RNA polymerase-domain-containing protein, partial [Blyttiomyces helicus]
MAIVAGYERRQWMMRLRNALSTISNCMMMPTISSKILADFSLPVTDQLRLGARSAVVVPLPPGSSWSGGFDAVLEPLPFDVRYMLHACIAARKIHIVDDRDAVNLAAALSRCSADCAIDILADVYGCHEGATTAEIIADYDAATDAVPDTETTPSLVRTRRVLVTPLTAYPQPPEVEEGNRVLRAFPSLVDRFMRVTFCDENLSSVLGARPGDILDRSGRVHRVMNNGLRVAGRLFKFLAYFNSQLREQSCWMYEEVPREGEDKPPLAEEIRASIGDMSKISFVGKKAARIGQAFSNTRRVATLPGSRVTTINDVERNGYCYTDGVGMISLGLAIEAALALGMRSTPSAFQVRFAGSKGVVAVWPHATPDLVLRPGMNKFDSANSTNDLE